jgi:hypothetical protein
MEMRAVIIRKMQVMDGAVVKGKYVAMAMTARIVDTAR